MEHQHIPNTHKDWESRNYQCVCGFKTGDRSKFDKHMRENDNKKIQQASPTLVNEHIHYTRGTGET